MTFPLKLGQLLHDRYLIQLNLGQGRLSRHYLASDAHRFDEPCLVRVFAPDLEPSFSPATALNRFQHQARTLYALEHPQIANFREFFALPTSDPQQFYLVQDFIEGQTYQDLLTLRRSQGQGFSEGEIKQLFRQLLPVLSYLHDQGVFHGPLAPGDIVQREIDGLPVLGEFSDAPMADGIPGGHLTQVPLPPGPENDLFFLGVTGVTLLSGQPPTVIKQSRSAWQTELDPLPLSRSLRALLLELLTVTPGSGLTSAAAVLTALDALPADEAVQRLVPSPSPTQPPDRALPEPLFADNPPEAVLPPPSDPPEQTPTPPGRGPLTPIAQWLSPRPQAPFFHLPAAKSMIKTKGVSGFFKKALLLLGLMAIASGLGWGGGKLWLTWRAQADLKAAQNAPPPPKTPLDLKNEIRTRRLNLGLSPQIFQGLVNDWLAFKFNQSPADVNDPPPGSEDEQLQTAIALLTTLETLSPEALKFLETNPPGDRRRWIPRVNQLRLSSRSFNDLVNARFRHGFPDLNPDDLTRSGTVGDRPLDQLWNALGLETLISLEDGSHYQRVSLGNESSLNLTGQFEPGRGYAYAINIPQGQFLDLKLVAPATARISFYSPSGREKMLENSPNHQWSGPLGETGYYELVITAQSTEPVSFQVQIQVR